MPQRASTRRQPKVDFSKLDVGAAFTNLWAKPSCRGCCWIRYTLLNLQHMSCLPHIHEMQATSLKKYRKLHDMEDLPPGASKEDMIPAVAKHFSQQVRWLKKHSNQYYPHIWHVRLLNSSIPDLVDCNVTVKSTVHPGYRIPCLSFGSQRLDSAQ